MMKIDKVSDKASDKENPAQKFRSVHNQAMTQDWFEFLRFPSVGTDPAHLADCENCAAWLTHWLEALGFEVTSLGSASAPKVLLATRQGDDAATRTVMLYGHYDVQPADPLPLWTSDPWEPAVRGDRVYARGAQDNKGQLWWSMQAIRACIETKTPLPTLKLVLDGQEESGSSELIKVVEARPELFKADVLMVADTGMMDDGRPAITIGLRGVSMLTYRLHGPDHDLHSGSHGGLAPNPAIELARIVASLHHADGSIAVEGFMDEVLEPTAAEITLAMSEPFDEAEYKRQTGVAPIGGQRGVAPQIRGRLAPTLEVNGFHSGYAGEGGKTIIPAYAEVKLSIRTVMGQIPERCLDAVKRHFEQVVKPGMRLEITYYESGGSALLVPYDSAAVLQARAILSRMHPRGCAVCYEGGSIHIIGALTEASGGAAILAGFGMGQDRIHSPNESYSFRQCEMCFDYTAAFLTECGAS